MMWKYLKLEDLITLQNGYAFKSSEYSENGYFVMRITNVQQGYIAKNNPKFIQVDNTSKLAKFILSAGDILLSLTGDVGRVGIINEEHLPAVLNQRVARVVNKDTSLLDTRYLFHFLNSKIFRHQVESFAHGAAQANVSTKDISQIAMQVPPLAEQQRIVAKLDAAFAEIDNLSSIENEKTFNSENIFNSYLSDIFTNSSSQYFDLESVCKITSSKRIMKADYVQSGIPFFRTKEIKQLANNHSVTTELFISEQQFIELDKKFGSPTEGDVLITAIGTIGEIYVVNKNDKFYFKDGNVLWLKELKNITPQYLKYALRNFVQQLNEMAHGAAYSALPIQRLKTFKIPLPSIDEQHEISKKLKDIEIQNIKHCKILTEKAALSKKLKSAILAQELQSGVA